MNNDKKTARLLGAAFIFVAIASMISGSALLNGRVWSGPVSQNLVTVSNSLSLMRVNIMGELVTSIGIVVLASLLYFVFYKGNKIVALVAFGWWLTEAATLAMSRVPAFSLVNLSKEFVNAGAPEGSYFQTFGRLYFEGAKFGYAIHMLFFCLGAIMWYYLFYKTRAVPRLLSIWGLAAVTLVLINELLWLINQDLNDVIILLLPYAPFELVLGGWLMIKGFSSASPASESADAESDLA